MSRYTTASLILVLLFLLTAKTFNYEQSLQEGYMDLVSYRFIVDNGFDSLNGPNHSSHHLERWPFHMITRNIVSFTHLDFWFIYKVLTFALLALTFLSIRSLQIPDNNKIASFALLLFNPYGFRLFYSIPGMISDTALYVGFLVVTCGLLNKSQRQIVLGLVLAVLGRQTSILLVPLFVGFWWLRELKVRDLGLYVSLLLGMFFINKYFTLYSFNPHSTDLVQQAFGLTMWFSNSFKWNEFFSFFGRYFIFILTLSPLVLLFSKYNRINLLFLGIFFFIHLQPIAFGPLVTGNNIARLSVLGLPFLISLLAYQKIQFKNLIYFLFCLFVLSLHHKFSFIYDIPGRKLLFAFFVFSTFLVVFYLKSRLVTKGFRERRKVAV